jgi:hypothetical protein
MAGLRFVFSRKVILATITLDLFAVLLGGATALMPIFADQILHCGRWVSAGCARCRQSGFCDGAVIAHLPPMKQAGKSVALVRDGFGLATIVFGLSKAILVIARRAFSHRSVRQRERDHPRVDVQLVTPDEMRGRVSSVNNIFIGTSNEFGALESD